MGEQERTRSGLGENFAWGGGGKYTLRPALELGLAGGLELRKERLGELAEPSCELPQEDLALSIEPASFDERLQCVHDFLFPFPIYAEPPFK